MKHISDNAVIEAPLTEAEIKEKLESDPFLLNLVNLSNSNHHNFGALCDLIYELKNRIDNLETQIDILINDKTIKTGDNHG